MSPSSSLVLFSLAPLNERAEAVVNHPFNQHLVSPRTLDGRPLLNIGHVRSKSGHTTLATIGRGDTDIRVNYSTISKIQCSFEIDLETNVIMFYDRSHGATSQVFGDNSFPFQYDRPRKVVVQDGTNPYIGMGGANQNLVQFELLWHRSGAETMKMVKARGHMTFEENPFLAQTAEAEIADTELPSQLQTRLQTAAPRRYIRWAHIDRLGSGEYGRVYKSVDVDSGKLMAVKELRRPSLWTEEEWRRALADKLKREVVILSEIRHQHIVDFIASYGWDEGQVKILMGLKDGTLYSLIQAGKLANDLIDTVFHHMLQAIDCLANAGIVHRDLKPENILYVQQGGAYQFQLGDFGLSNHQNIARSNAGSPLYMAPEISRNGKQTHKADVWSLHVTMLWTMDVGGFRETSRRLGGKEDVQAAVLSAADDPMVSIIKEMVCVDPEERASAAQMLVKCFQGRGLSTPPSQVPPLLRLLPLSP
ncbi:protein kinase-like protein [Xylariomycetidae sp. FL2044]|nr:protein kinase-like protein [Xylariomycetidae sp. FL2044]